MESVCGKIVGFSTMSFAGSAIAQNAGKLDNFESWRPGGPQETKWLLLSGSTDPPCETSTRRTRNVERGGSFLRGVTNDLATMEASEVVTESLYNAVRDYYLETLQELRMLSPSLFIQGSQCKC